MPTAIQAPRWFFDENTIGVAKALQYVILGVAAALLPRSRGRVVLAVGDEPSASRATAADPRRVGAQLGPA